MPPTPRPAKPSAPTRLAVTEPAELLLFLLEKLPQKTRNDVKSLLKNQQISVDGQATTQYNLGLVPGQEVEVAWIRAAPEPRLRGLRVVFEDEHLIVVEKAAGLLSIATEKQKLITAYSLLSGYLKQKHPGNKIFVVHRLDRDTSGLLLFAKNPTVQQRLQQAWQEAIDERTYLAVTEGVVRPPEGTVSSYLHESKALIVYSDQNPRNGQWAVTHYQTLNQSARHSLLQVELETGRKNQIRVHLQELGHPVVGDRKYGATTDPLGRLGLHAWVLAFQHPITGEALRFETAVPGAFSKVFR